MKYCKTCEISVDDGFFSCPKCHGSLVIDERELQRQKDEQNAIIREKKQRLKTQGYTGYYEYQTKSVLDLNNGNPDIVTIDTMLNTMGIEGWQLKMAMTNDLGVTGSTGGHGGFSVGTNATISASILIFERFVLLDGE